MKKVGKNSLPGIAPIIPQYPIATPPEGPTRIAPVFTSHVAKGPSKKQTVTGCPPKFAP